METAPPSGNERLSRSSDASIRFIAASGIHDVTDPVTVALGGGQTDPSGLPGTEPLSPPDSRRAAPDLLQVR